MNNLVFSYLSLVLSFLNCHILVVFRHEPSAIEMVIIIDVDLLCDKYLDFSYTRFLLHWLKNVRNMEEQCVLGQTMEVFLIV